MLDAKLAPRLLEAGFTILRKGATVLVAPASKLTPEQFQEIARSKLVLFADFEALPPQEGWDEYEARRLCEMGAIKSRRFDTDDPVAVRAVSMIKDRADYAFINRDLAKVRAEVAGLLVGIDAVLPRQVGAKTQYEPSTPGRSFTGWLRYNGSPWLAIMSDVHDRSDLEDAMLEYRQLYKTCDIIVLPTGESP